MPNHSEQYFNAKTLEKIGLAIYSKEHEIFKNLKNLKLNFSKMKKKFATIKVKNGSRFAASFILSKLN